MNKTVLYLLITIGGAIGAYLPVLFGANGFSVWSVIGQQLADWLEFGWRIKFLRCM